MPSFLSAQARNTVFDLSVLPELRQKLNERGHTKLGTDRRATLAVTSTNKSFHTCVQELKSRETWAVEKLVKPHYKPGMLISDKEELHF
ncbi:hypothetical protein RRG08_057413 [Elysia crispata]|uniref:Uncharacterized protein n=1 Tax=Elysia crispata TaxID=231223 RepID=A0AAE1ADM2_9GAST|nr:hypothetical protein RRG08_057413 [Elysia crispata]